MSLSAHLVHGRIQSSRRQTHATPGRMKSMTSNPLFLLVLAAAHAATSGHSECPCIDPWATGGLQLRGNAPPVGAAAGCDITRGDDSACFASSYGATGCAAHDSSSSACTATVEPGEWCAVEWCYVDAAACLRPNSPSVYFNDARLSTSASGPDPYDAHPLTYSYETCGNTDEFSNSFEGSVRLLREWAASRPNGKLRIGVGPRTGNTNLTPQLTCIAPRK